MKLNYWFLTSAIIIVCLATFSFADSIETFVIDAEKLNNEGKLDEAIDVIKAALNSYQDNAVLTSYLGFYTGMKAGRTQNYMEAGRLVQEAFTLLDKAVQLAPDNYLPHFQRGILGVQVPLFLGRMDEGIQDLEFIVELAETKATPINADVLGTGYLMLANAYEQKEQHDQAIEMLNKIVKLDPDSPNAKQAALKIKSLTEKEQPGTAKKYSTEDIATLEASVSDAEDHQKLVDLGYAYLQQHQYEKARETFNTAIKHDSTNANAYLGLTQTIGALADKGYDKTIYTDTDYRTKLAFDVVKITDIAARKCPESPEIRLLKGGIGIGMPFFVGKLDEAMEDLNWVIENDYSSAETKAEALYYLGLAYKKKSITSWIKIVTDYPNTKIVDDVFTAVTPHVERLDKSKLKKPIVTIDFILGFQDELAPQTAVWIETKNGHFIKTIYVSGFSGFAKEKQINLTQWSESSAFKDTDAVTAASIDVGHHLYTWNLNDLNGNIVKPGEYVVKVEVCYWPSMQYQLVSCDFKIDKTEMRQVKEEGNFIPYLEVIYYPKSGK